MARRKELVLASVPTIVVVAGQTQVHTVTVVEVRPAIVPPIVPARRPSKCGRHKPATSLMERNIHRAHRIIHGFERLAAGRLLGQKERLLLQDVVQEWRRGCKTRVDFASSRSTSL